MAKLPATDPDAPASSSDEEAIVREAKRRFALCEQWEANARDLFTDDLKFVHGDADNNWQWPTEIYSSRTSGEAKRPCLTVNKVKQHANLVVNDAKQNKIGIAVHPTGDEATYEAAQTYEGLIRQIEYHSRATDAYDKAAEFQTYAGLGFIRVTTEYESNDTFDQEIYIKRVNNPLAYYIDPDAQEADKSDMRFAFEFDDMAKDAFKEKYPKFADELPPQSTLGSRGDDWVKENTVRVARYWRRSQKADNLVHLIDPQSGEESFVRRSHISPEIWKLLTKDGAKPKMRPIIDDVVEWYEIGADKILDRGEWAGKYIPLVPVIWEEVVIDGILDRKGLVRAMKDPQRLYNYYTSAGAESVALQSKTPYIGPMDAFEGYEAYWNNANKENFAWLPFNHRDEQGNEIPRPERQPPPVMPDAFVKGMEVSQQEMMMASGQYQAQMGENENAKSGKAIFARQRQGDRATYQGIDGLAIAVRQVGRIVLDLIPKIYDTKRVKQILAEDGERGTVQIDPNADQALVKQEAVQDNAASMIFNPSVGKYAVHVDVGPNYATRREEAFNAFTQIMQSDSSLIHVAGDLLFKNMDVPGADELAERLRRLVPPQALGTGPSPSEMQMQQQMMNLQNVLQEMGKKLAEADMKLKAKDEQKEIDAYDAESRRITALGNSGPALSPEEIRPLVQQLIAETLGVNIDQVTDTTGADMSAMAASQPSQQPLQQPTQAQ